MITRREFHKMLAGAFALAALPKVALAASYDRACDVYQGFNFRKDKVTTVGFITKLKVGSVEMKADLSAKDPTDATKELKAVAILSSQSWGLGVTDGIYTNGQVSETNRQEIQTLLYNDLSDVAVEYQCTVYEYDPRAKKYFKGFHSEDTDLKGKLEKQGPEVALDVATAASTEVKYPENYAFFIGLKPQRQEQTITIQVSDRRKVAKQWGMKVG